MNDQELRKMIRESIARQTSDLAQGRPAGAPGSRPATGAFARLPLLRSGDDSGACLIEPSVQCNHCGYCLSYGH